MFGLSIYLILKALENKLSLTIFILPDPFFCVMVFLLTVEHVTTQVQHGSLVHLGCITIPVEVILVQYCKFVNPFHYVYFLHLLLELVLAQVRKCDQQMHQNTHLHGLSDEL